MASRDIAMGSAMPTTLSGMRHMRRVIYVVSYCRGAEGRAGDSDQFRLRQRKPLPTLVDKQPTEPGKGCTSRVRCRTPVCGDVSRTALGETEPLQMDRVDTKNEAGLRHRQKRAMLQGMVYQLPVRTASPTEAGFRSGISHRVMYLGPWK